MELLHTVKRKSAFSEIAYYALNIGLAAALLIISQTIQHPAFAIILVLLSKWRVFAVRPRYWWTNVQANMVDIIVGLSVAMLMYIPNVSFVVQVLLALFYAAWLVVLKPMSKRAAMMWQAAIAILLGTTALFMVSYEWPVSGVVVAMVIIGYSAARHFLFAYEEPNIVLLSAIWGVMCAEIGWLAHYWTFAYTIPGNAALKIPQVTIILLLLSFLTERTYRSWKKHGAIELSDVMPPALLTAALTFVILVFFNSVTI